MAPTAPRPSTHGSSPNTTALDFASCSFNKFLIFDLPDDATARCLHAKDVHSANYYTPIVRPLARRFHGLPLRHAAAPLAGAFPRPDRQRRRLRAEKLPLDDALGAAAEPGGGPARE